MQNVTSLRETMLLVVNVAMLLSRMLKENQAFICLAILVFHIRFYFFTSTPAHMGVRCSLKRGCVQFPTTLIVHNKNKQLYSLIPKHLWSKPRTPIAGIPECPLELSFVHKCPKFYMLLCVEKLDHESEALSCTSVFKFKVTDSENTSFSFKYSLYIHYVYKFSQK
jgi:hypothetical protein